MSEFVTVYTLEHCSFCVRAKNLLAANEIAFREIRVADDDRCTKDELEERSGLKTFPQIFFGNTVIGGFSHLQELDREHGIKQVVKRMIGD
jgi:glutaredoxin 3